MDDFAAALVAWYGRHGRHDLPWQRPRTPYRVWVAEVMLQQTQVATVVPYFERFMERFPSLPALAEAHLDAVLAAWSGLGYYQRARHLHAAARRCVEQHGGELPADPEALAALPGIGRSTAHAILAQAHGRRAAILDGNVKRVLARWHGVEGWPGMPAVERQLWRYAEQHTPAGEAAAYTQAIMDLGALVCRPRRPACPACPVAFGCRAYRDGRVAELPTPKSPRALPQRRAWWWVLLDPERRMLLERRPPIGLWGGLWCFPTSAEPGALAAECARLGVEIRQLREAAAPIRHRFSHFEWLLTPVPVEVWRGVQVEDSDRAWYSVTECKSLGLPSPVRTWIESATPVLFSLT